MHSCVQTTVYTLYIYPLLYTHYSIPTELYTMLFHYLKPHLLQRRGETRALNDDLHIMGLKLLIFSFLLHLRFIIQ